MADIATGQSPAATVTGVKLTRRTMHFDARESLAELGVNPRPIDESLRDAVEWYRERGWI
jgi:dihydroflavonol-4-reductase